MAENGEFEDEQKGESIIEDTNEGTQGFQEGIEKTKQRESGEGKLAIEEKNKEDEKSEENDDFTRLNLVNSPQQKVDQEFMENPFYSENEFEEGEEGEVGEGVERNKEEGKGENGEKDSRVINFKEEEEGGEDHSQPNEISENEIKPEEEFKRQKEKQKTLREEVERQNQEMENGRKEVSQQEEQLREVQENEQREENEGEEEGREIVMEGNHKPIELVLSPKYSKVISPNKNNSGKKKKQIKRIPKKKLIEGKQLPPSFIKQTSPAEKEEEEAKKKNEEEEKEEKKSWITAEKIVKGGQQWIEIKWKVLEAKKGDLVRLFRLSNAHEREHSPFQLKTEGTVEGMTHLGYPQHLGKFRAEYIQNDKVFVKCEPIEIGPSVKLEAKLIPKKNLVKVKWEIRLGTGIPNQWDWIGLFPLEEIDPTNYWSYQFVNLKSNQLYFEPPKKPGDWKFLYFSSSSKYYSFGESNSFTIEGLI